MNDMRPVIVPKSDQINADDLIPGPLTIKVTKVTISPGEQPVSIFFDGDGGKPYRPCKIMSRVLVSVWGPDANAYAGRSMTLYRDPGVTWGGLAVGGIRISHMSHLATVTNLALTETKGRKKPFTVRPLAEEPKKRLVKDILGEIHASLNACHTVEEVETITATDDVKKALARFTNGALAELNAMLAEAITRVTENEGASHEPDDIFPGDLPLNDGGKQ